MYYSLSARLSYHGQHGELYLRSHILLLFFFNVHQELRTERKNTGDCKKTTKKTEGMSVHFVFAFLMSVFGVKTDKNPFSSQCLLIKNYLR